MRLELHRCLLTLLALWMLPYAAPCQNGPAVTGESWLSHLQRPFDETSMGKTGDLGPAALPPSEAQPVWYPTLSPNAAAQPVTLRGSDLYRFTCQGCHGEGGLGSPPEIHSVINPVRATSAALVMERMKNSGMEISPANASQMAKQAKDALLLRLQKGGEAMPSFAHLRPAEERLVLSYLNELAGVSRGSAARGAVVESPVRVGELIVKSTCHICHDAAGANPDPEQILQGVIPPLSTLTSRTNEAEFIRKVTHGAPVLMGDLALPARGRMPVFYYLSQDEAADIYLYLTLYPPRAAAAQHTMAARTNDSQNTKLAATTTDYYPVPPSPPTPPAAPTNGTMLFAILGLAGLVGALLVGGLAITVRELKRLSTESESQGITEQPAAVSAMQPLVLIQKGSNGEPHMRPKRFGTLHHLLGLALMTFVLASCKVSYAIPAFARMYGTSCSTCHIDFPKLNDFGKAFKDAGFKFPKDDEQMLKIPPVMLGAPANAELWPKAIWPGTIPGQPPIGLRYNNYFQYTGSNRSRYSRLLPPGTVPPYIPATDFETGFFSIFTAGNFGSDIAFWVDDDISVAGANSNGSLGQGYLKFVNIGRLLKMPEYALNFRIGQIELEIPFTQALSIWTSPYDIYTQANIGVVNTSFNQQFITNNYTFAGSGKGIEFSGGRHTGGYNYSLAFIDQSTSGAAQANNNAYVPTATGGNQGGVGIASDANFKDIYASFNYRVNLEKNKESRKATQAAGSMGPRDHTYANFGSYYMYGRSVQRLSGQTLDGAATVLTAREPFYRVGGNFTFNYRCCLQFNALYMYGHDYNLLPVDSTGTLVPLPPSNTSPVGFVHGSPSTFSGGFADVEWLAYPWMYVMFRYDGVNSNADYRNALVSGGFTGSPFNGAASTTRNRFTPAVQFLIHPNIKAVAEYQIRPSQSVQFATNPINGLPVAVNSFHTNTLVMGFEFAY